MLWKGRATYVSFRASVRRYLDSLRRLAVYVAHSMVIRILKDTGALSGVVKLHEVTDIHHPCRLACCARFGQGSAEETSARADNEARAGMMAVQQAISHDTL